MKRIFCLLFIVGVLTTGLYFLTYSTNHEQASENKKTDNFTELTLKEAYQAGLNYAKKNWNTKAKLITITSIDSPKGSKGVDGKRQLWNMLFYNPKSNETLIETIRNNKIVKSIPTNEVRKDQDFINIEKINFDSPDILKKAKKDFFIKPGVGWANGYHYVLKKRGGEILFGIIARDNKGRITKVFFNNNGEIKSSVHKVPYGGGLKIVGKSGTKNVFSKSAIVGLDFFGKEVTFWGAEHPMSENIKPLALTKKGTNFLKLYTNGFVQSIWHLNKNNFFVVYDHSIQLFQDHKFKKQEFHFKNKIVQTSQGTNGLAILTNNKILQYEKGDDKWIKLKKPDGTHQVFIDIENRLYVFTKNRDIYFYKDSKWIKIDYPKENIHGKLVAHVDNKFIFAGPDIINFFNPKNKNKEVIHLPSRLKKIIYEQDSKQFFIQYRNGKISNILKGGEDKWLIKNLDTGLHGNLMDVAKDQEGNFYFATTPEYKWTPYPKKEEENENEEN